MPKRSEVYKCNLCGNIVEVTHGGSAALVCCGQNMDLMSENTVDAATEKHVPVIRIDNDSVTVKVGDVPHPMEDSHYIEWIELLADDRVYRKYLNPGDAPEATFAITAQQLTAREYCNLHGLWKAES